MSFYAGQGREGLKVGGVVCYWLGDRAAGECRGDF